MCELFRRTGKSVAQHFGFNYPADDDAKVSAHLKRVRVLPPDAAEMY